MLDTFGSKIAFLVRRTVADDRTQRSGRAWRGYAIATTLIVGATGLGYFWTSISDPRNLSLVFFGAVLLAGVLLGMRPALYVALLAFLCYNFFLVEPRFTVHIAPADILAFASFLVGAVVVGGLAGRLSDRARDATDRLRDLTALFEASRDLSQAVAPKEAATRMVRHLEQGGCTAAVWLGDNDRFDLAAASRARQYEADASHDAVAALLATSWRDDVQSGRWLLRLETGERALGTVAIWPPGPGVAILPDRRWIEAIMELGAVAIDRARLIHEVAEATIVAEKEGLRTALLSSLSHDLRTPISTILASVTSLEEHDTRFDAATRREMMETIQEESERLNRYVANLLEMTRLESGALDVKRVLIDPGEAIASALERLRSRQKDRLIVRTFQTGRERIFVDPVLIEQAIVNVLENAFTHSAMDSTVRLGTTREDDIIVLAIEDEGPGIPADDLARVFDKFFRGRSDRRAGAGVGLGLSVARGLVESFDGEVRAISPATKGKGARIELRLPAHPAMEPIE